MIGFLVTHELLGIHEMHLFAPEGLLPASIGALVLLLVADRVRRATRHKTTSGSAHDRGLARFRAHRDCDRAARIRWLP